MNHIIYIIYHSESIFTVSTFFHPWKTPHYISKINETPTRQFVTFRNVCSRPVPGLSVGRSRHPPDEATPSRMDGVDRWVWNMEWVWGGREVEVMHRDISTQGGRGTTRACPGGSGSPALAAEKSAPATATDHDVVVLLRAWSAYSLIHSLAH